MMKLIVFCAFIAIVAGAPSVALIEPTTVLGRIEPQPQAPASTEHAKLVPALRYSPLVQPVVRYAFDNSLRLNDLGYVALPYSRPFEAHNYRIIY